MSPETTSDCVLFVAGMNCSGCVGTFTRKALGIYGVVHVDVDLVPGGESRVTIRHAEVISPDLIAAALVRAGYPVALPAHW